MSADTLRKMVIEEIEKRNVEAMNNACGVRPSLQTTADGIALLVVDQLAMARAYAMCSVIVNEQYKKLTSVPDDAPKEKQKIREVY